MLSARTCDTDYELNYQIKYAQYMKMKLLQLHNLHRQQVIHVNYY